MTCIRLGIYFLKVIIFWTCVVDSLYTFADEQGHSLKDWLLHVDPIILGIM